MNIPPNDNAKIKKAIFLTKLYTWIEKYWSIFLSFLSVWGIYLCLGLLGLPLIFPDIIRVIILLLVALGSIGLVILQIKRKPLPKFIEILKRIEDINKLPHHPLQTLYDTPTQINSRTTWNTHLKRVFEKFPPLKVGAPRIFKGHYHLNRLAIVTVCIFAALFVSHTHSAPSRLLSAVRPGYDDITVPLPTIQAWIMPPSFSSAAPIYIKSNHETIQTDPQARLHISITDLKQKPDNINRSKDIVLSNITTQKVGHRQWQIEGQILKSGELNITSRGRTLAAWNFKLPANLPPQVTWTGPIKKSEYDWKTAFPFQASQHYGIQSIHLSVTVPDSPNNPRKEILSLTLPLGDHPKLIKQTLNKDLSDSIWAGSPAYAIISANDVTGQSVESKKTNFTLPKREFTSPLVKKLDQIRQAYGTNQISQGQTMNALINLQSFPDAFTDYDLFLNYVSIIYFLDNTRNDPKEVKAETLSRLWNLMVDTEDRSNSNSEIARANIELKAAQESVQEQLDKMQRLGKNNITNQDRQELSRRLERLQNAVAQKMAALAKQNMKDHPTNTSGKEVQFVSTRSFQDMFKDMEKTLESGDMDKAMQQLEYTNQVLNTMRSATPEDLKKLEQQVQAQKDMQKLNESLEALIKEQQALLDQSYARQGKSVPILLQPNQDLNQLSTPELLKQITPPKQTEHEQRDGHATVSIQQSEVKQQELIQELSDLQSKMQAITKQPIENFNNATNEMKSADQSLQNGNDSKAAEHQSKALIELQKGKQSAKKNMQQQAQQFSNFFPVFSARNPSEDPSGDPKEANDKKKDPLGRSLDNDKTQIDLEGNSNNARKIEEELRKRADDLNRSSNDLDYIYRLLNMF